MAPGRTITFTFLRHAHVYRHILHLHYRDQKPREFKSLVQSQKLISGKVETRTQVFCLLVSLSFSPVICVTSELNSNDGFYL